MPVLSVNLYDVIVISYYEMCIPMSEGPTISLTAFIPILVDIVPFQFSMCVNLVTSEEMCTSPMNCEP